MNNRLFAITQKGFTLVELIVVIVLLGILAATAAPKMIGMTSDAKMAKLHGFAAAMQSGVVLAVSKWQIAGYPSAGISMGGNTVKFQYGFPTSSTVINVLDSFGGSGISAGSTMNGGPAAFCNANANGKASCGSPPPQITNETGADLQFLQEMRADYGYCAIIYYPPTSNGGTFQVDTSFLTAANCP